MTEPELTDWREQNRAHLSAAIDELHLRIRLEAGEPVADELDAMAGRLATLRADMSHPPALERVCEVFALDGFEGDIFLLCAAYELDPRFQLEGIVTIGSVLGTLPGAHWTGLDLASPLRRWGIVTVSASEPFVGAQLRGAADVIRYLLGFDPRAGLRDGVTPVADSVPAGPALVAVAHETARAVELAGAVTQLTPAVELHGASGEQRLALAQQCAAELGLAVAVAGIEDVPPPGAEFDELVWRWNRCGALTDTSLLVSCAGHEGDPGALHRVQRLADTVVRPLFISATRPLTIEPRCQIIRRLTPDPTRTECVATWQQSVDVACARLEIEPSSQLTAEITALSTQFLLSGRVIERICLEAEAAYATSPLEGDGDPAPDACAALGRLLRRGCARFVRAQLDPLAERVPLVDVVEVALPELERAALQELEAQIRLSHTVNEAWGLGRGREGGLTALFSGPSGTGKTQAALALASHTGLDLYRINVASVLSKYIGETEQNLDRIFEAARVGGVILLFDEADALFGKRAEVKDAHDRYANLGTAYLLQRIEHAPTPTILTTNLKEGLDPAFTRRLDFVVDFSFPGTAEREQIWAEIYPPSTPRRELRPAALAQLSVTGGTISGIARRGAFLAAAESSEVEMRHLRESATRELRKIGRHPAVEELAGW